VLFSKNLTRKILNLLGLSILVTAFIVIPSLLENLNFFDLPFLGDSVQAQPPVPGVSEEVEIDAFNMTMGALAGLVLFIYGVTRLAEGLENVAGDRMKDLVSKFTTNRFAGVLTGTVATTLLESSSVTIIMTIAMVSAGLLTFAQSLGVVLGSNIGTTIGAQLISLNINLYAPIAMLIGAVLQFAGRTDNQKSLGLILLGIGLLFFGLDVIDETMKPFRDYQPFINLMGTLGRNPILGALIGALFTVLIQSSSATVAIVITLAGSGLVSLPAGIALMLGAEVGTCADTLVSTIGRGRPALRTGVFHFLFNLTSAIIGIIFAPQLAQLVLAISGDNVGRQIANAQVIFNVIGVAAVIGFVPLIVRGLEKLIPDRKLKQQAQHV
jgi:phosphate:Na+ symporter